MLTYLHLYLHTSQPMEPHPRLARLLSTSLPAVRGTSFPILNPAHLRPPSPSESDPSLEHRCAFVDPGVSCSQSQRMAEAFVPTLAGLPGLVGTD